MIHPDRSRRGLLCVVASFAVLAAPLSAQAPVAQRAEQGVPGAKKVLTVDDYSKWRNVDAAQISGNGRWVATVLRFTNVPQNDSKPELHLRDLDADREVVIAHASNPEFSPDSRWLVYQVDSIPQRAGGRGGRGGGGADSSTATPANTPGASAAQGAGRGNAAATPLRRYELRELSTGATQAWKDIQGATFAATSRHLLLRRQAAGAAAGAAGRGGAPGGPPGAPGGGGRGGATRAPPIHAASTSCWWI